MLDLVCLGNVTIDDVVLADGTTRPGCLGGDAIYAALSARLWSAAVAPVAPVGDDWPEASLCRIEVAGLETTGMPRRALPTRRNRVVYEADGSRTWFVQSNPADFAALSPTLADIPEAYRTARCMLVLAMDLACQEALVAGLRGHGALIALDPKEDTIAGNEARILAMLAGVDVFLPSEIEAERLVGHRDYRTAARTFAARGCRVVVVKLGARGALVYDAAGERFLEVPAAPAVVVDTTGAGDAFSGAFMAVYAQTRDVERAARAAAVSGAFAVEDFGTARLFDLTPADARARLEQTAREAAQ